MLGRRKRGARRFARDSASALAHSDFRRLFIAQTVSSFGDALLPVALTFAVIESGGSASDIGLVLGAALLPTVALTLVGGVWADRVSRRAILVGSDALQGFCQGATAYLLLSGTAEVWHLVVLQALNGIGRAFFHPAVGAIVPSTVPAKDLQQANALIESVRNVNSIAGPAAAGVLFALSGAGLAILVDAATFAISMVALMLMRGGDYRVNSPDVDSSLLRDLRDGWAMVRSRRWLWVELVRSAFDFPIVVAPFLVLGPLIAIERLGGAHAWAAIAAAFSVGALAGSAIATRYQARRPMFTCTALMYLTALPPLMLAYTNTAMGVAAIEGIRGAAVGFFGATWVTLLQEQIPDRVRGRVNAWDLTITYGLTPFGYILAAPLAARFSQTAVLTMSGLWAVVSVSVALAVPEIRQLRRAPLAGASEPSDPEKLAVAEQSQAN
ncbi:MAG TPA: MFS transporter [Chloroflexota bacterium]|nr:MFS transporter [Chloroflexota bacterium]